MEPGSSLFGFNDGSNPTSRDHKLMDTPRKLTSYSQKDTNVEHSSGEQQLFSSLFSSIKRPSAEPHSPIVLGHFTRRKISKEAAFTVAEHVDRIKKTHRRPKLPLKNIPGKAIINRDDGND